MKGERPECDKNPVRRDIAIYLQCHVTLNFSKFFLALSICSWLSIPKIREISQYFCNDTSLWISPDFPSDELKSKTFEGWTRLLASFQQKSFKVCHCVFQNHSECFRKWKWIQEPKKKYLLVSQAYLNEEMDGIFLVGPFQTSQSFFVRAFTDVESLLVKGFANETFPEKFFLQMCSSL